MTPTEAELVLGLSRPYDRDAVSRAYRQLSKIAHPDRPEGSEAAFRRIAEARDILFRSLSSPPRSPSRPEAPPPPRRRDDVHDGAWRARQHRPYGTMDARSPGIGTGERLEVHLVILDRGEPLIDSPSWGARFSVVGDSVLAILVPPDPIHGCTPMECTLVFCVPGDDEKIGLRGPVTSVRRDREERIVAILADLLPR